MAQQIEMQGMKVIDDIHSLIRRGETLEIEFKEDNSSFHDTRLFEVIVAMTNTLGGHLLFGVADTGEVKGCHRFGQGNWQTEEAIAGMIMANTLPACATAVSVHEFERKKILMIRIPRSTTTTGTKSGKFLKRQLDAKGRPQDLPMTADDIISGVTRVGVQDFSATVLTEASIEDLDLDLVSEVSRRRSSEVVEPFRKEGFLKSPLEVLRALGLLSLDDNKPNIAALLLFGRVRVLKAKFPNHELHYQVFGPRGEILNNITISGPIAETFPKLLELSEMLRNSNEFRFRGSNVVIPEYPEDSRRETIANAIVHRDYTLSSSVQIQLFEKELIVSNPGSFPAGVTISNLLSVSPTPRNRKLADAMRDFGFVESSGRGIDLIFQGQAKYGRPAPDYSASESTRVSVRLIGGQANLDFCKFIVSSSRSPSIVELLLLNALFFRRDLSLEQLAVIIQKPMSVTHEILGKLREDKLVEITSERNPKYLLRGSANRNAMKAVKPVRMTNDQRDQFKIKLLEELNRDSPIVIAEIADRVGLSPSQARRLLNQLRDQKSVRNLKSRKWELC